jgi:hypothetical protein
MKNLTAVLVGALTLLTVAAVQLAEDRANVHAEHAMLHQQTANFTNHGGREAAAGRRECQSHSGKVASSWRAC